MEQLAEDTPAVVLIDPVPLTPATAVVHPASEYTAKLTEPVGGTVLVPTKVAASLTVRLCPAVPAAGFAVVVIVGEALPTTRCSLVQRLLAPLLLVSPENTACQSKVPAELKVSVLEFGTAPVLSLTLSVPAAWEFSVQRLFAVHRVGHRGPADIRGEAGQGRRVEVHAAHRDRARTILMARGCSQRGDRRPAPLHPHDRAEMASAFRTRRTCVARGGGRAWPAGGHLPSHHRAHCGGHPAPPATWRHALERPSPRATLRGQPSTMQRIWKEHGLRPRRTRSFKFSNHRTGHRSLLRTAPAQGVSCLPERPRAALSHPGDPPGARQLPHPQTPARRRLAGGTPALQAALHTDERQLAESSGTWFSLLQRRAIQRGVFSSVAALEQAIRRILDGWNDHSHPFAWGKTPEEVLTPHRQRISESLDQLPFYVSARCAYVTHHDCYRRR